MSSEIPTATPRQAHRALIRLVRPERGRIVVAMLVLVVATSFQLSATRLLGHIIDLVSSHAPVSEVNSDGLAIVCVIVVAVILTFCGRVQLGGAVERTMKRLREDAFHAVLQMPLDVAERAGTSEPLSRMTSDVATIADAMHDVFPMVVSGGLISALALVAIVSTGPVLGLAAASGFLVLAVVAVRYFRYSSAAYRGEREATAAMLHEMHEIADGARTIRTFGQQEIWVRKMRDATEKEWESAWGPTRARCQLYSGSNAARTVSIIAVLFAGMVAYRNGWASLGAVSAAALYVVQLYTPIGDLLDSVDSLQQSTAAYGRLVGLTLMKPRSVASSRRPVDGGVVLDDVYFEYETGQPVLRGVGLEVASGERIAVVGASGAGKSTIAKLVAGIHSPASGSVRVGGALVSLEVADESQRGVALVTQESHVFNATLADNLRLAASEATDSELVDALNRVGASDWLEILPDGLNAHVGHGGQTLTLLQAQQVALARVVLSDPLFVILDEATAAFDGDSARGVERSFAAVFEGRTVVTIAHRLDVARTADRIVVVDAGTATSASHDELLRTHDGYASLWRHWTNRSRSG